MLARTESPDFMQEEGVNYLLHWFSIDGDHYCNDNMLGDISTLVTLTGKTNVTCFLFKCGYQNIFSYGRESHYTPIGQCEVGSVSRCCVFPAPFSCCVFYTSLSHWPFPGASVMTASLPRLISVSSPCSSLFQRRDLFSVFRFAFIRVVSAYTLESESS